MAAASANQFEEALQNALKTIEIDKNFGLGYLIAANQSANLGRSADERKYLEAAMQHLDGMTDRERYHTRGAYGLATADYQQCVKEYSEAIAQYRADISGRNQLALCLTHQRADAAGGRGDAGSRQDPAEPAALPRQPRALPELRRRLSRTPSRRRAR